MARSISEAMSQALEEFKTSPEMRNLNVEFGQEAFIKGFELCEGRIARRFPELDLRFLGEEDDDADAGPSIAVVDPTLDELAPDQSEPALEAPESVPELEAAESDPVPPSVVPPEVEILE
ncbi:hypothetical protein COCNU_scaffold011442G000020 [Cocos nucifera]|nr:hypothetical protein [Cocos nucifera]